MARLARMIIPGVSHHVTQRGNRCERIFFEDGDEQIYLDLLSAQLNRYAVECWASTRLHRKNAAKAKGQAWRKPGDAQLILTFDIMSPQYPAVLGARPVFHNRVPLK